MWMKYAIQPGLPLSPLFVIPGWTEGHLFVIPGWTGNPIVGLMPDRVGQDGEGEGGQDGEGKGGQDGRDYGFQSRTQRMYFPG